MTLYARTPEGQLAAYSAESALPRKLKSLLKLVDGKIELEMLVQGLQAFGDVRGVLQSLHAAGLLKVISGNGKSVSSLSSEADTSSAACSTSGPDTLAVSRHSTQVLTTISANPARQQALAQAVDLMVTFVLTHIPVDSSGILKELKSLQSLEQLGATLGGYEQDIIHVGSATRDHLSQIRQILREHL